MPQKHGRRRFVTGVGVAGLAGLGGCAGRLEKQISGVRGETPPETSDEKNASEEPATEETASEETSAEDRHFHQGETIPTYPYGQTGSEPLNPRADTEVENPVLTADDVDDVDAGYVYNPFLYVEDEEWHMFFTVSADGRGRIAHASSDDRGVTWEYDRLVLNLRNNVAFPNVFKWEGSYYMTVQRSPGDSPVSLYKANSFPSEWYEVTELFDPTDHDHEMTDRSLFHWDDQWWCIGGDNREDTYLYYSDELERSGWEPHDLNPVVESRPAAARPGGRPIVRENDVLMFFQSLVGGFGTEVNAYRISELTPSTYEDERHPASPLVRGTDRLTSEGEAEWNADRMHHYDPWYLGEGEGWRIAVDGDDGDDDWSIGIYHVNE